MPSEDDEVSYEIASDVDGRCHTVSVICSAGLSHEEFGAALISLGEDILKGKVDLNEGAELASLN